MQQRIRDIKAVIFDYGGVLMRTESQESRERVARQADLSPARLYHLVFDSEDSRLAQLGLLSPEARWARIGHALGMNTPEEVLALRHDMFGGDVLGIELVNDIRRLRRRYKTALLSNSSIRLVTVLRDELHIDDCFDAIVISAQVRLMKPDPAIYHLTLDRLQVAAHEAVFVDDAPQNVQAAAALGMRAIRFTTREALLAELRPLLDPIP